MSTLHNVKLNWIAHMPRLATGLLWLVASSIMLVVLLFDQSSLSGYGQIASILFIVALLVYLGRSKPIVADLPDVEPMVLPKFQYVHMLLLILGILVLLFLVGIVLHPWLVIIAALTIIALWVIIRQRQRLSPRLVLLGFAGGAFCLFLSWRSARLDGFQGFYLACIPLHFIAGGLLLQVTGLTQARCVDGSWRLVWQGFLWGCLLALPSALLNSSGGTHAGDAWVDQLWEPFVAFVPGIAEEIWARLFLTTLIYALLRPTCKQLPNRALMAAISIAAIAHGLAHLPGAMVFSPAALQGLLAAFLFGVPMGLLFVKRDFEHAVGYHFLIDFVRFAVAI